MIAMMVRSANGLSSVGDARHLVVILAFHSSLHLTYYLLRVLEARVVAGYYETVRQLHCRCSHLRTLVGVTVAASASHCDESLVVSAYLVDGRQHILQSVGSVCVVDYADYAVL